MFNKKKYFIVSMISTTMVIALMLGFIVVEKNAMSIISPEKSQFFSYHLSKFIPDRVNLHFMGKDFVFQLGH